MSSAINIPNIPNDIVSSSITNSYHFFYLQKQCTQTICIVYLHLQHLHLTVRFMPVNHLLSV